jgi:hypothetical protein
MKTAILTTFIIALALNTAFAVGDNSNSEEVLITKAKAKAENTKNGDWRALADCAKSLLDQRIKCEDELKWLQKSLSIEENYYNLALLGDYYRLNRDFTKAYENYINAILSAQKNSKSEAIPDIQWKILITMGTKNYYEFQGKQANN